MSSLGNKQVFSANLSYYMAVNGVSRLELSRVLDIRYSTLCEWISARKYPRIDNIEKLALYFGVPKSALIELRHQQVSDADRLLCIYNDMTENGQRQLLSYAEFLYQSNKKSDTISGVAE